MQTFIVYLAIKISVILQKGLKRNFGGFKISQYIRSAYKRTGEDHCGLLNLSRAVRFTLFEENFSLKKFITNIEIVRFDIRHYTVGTVGKVYTKGPD